MLKKGFTLAEVLITLSIIGVIASLTLPALMTNTREQQAKTALKKGINTLTQAANMNAAQFGSDFSVSANSAVDDVENKSSLMAVFKNQLSRNDKAKGTNDGIISANITNYNIGRNNFAIFLQDGSSIIFPKTIPANGAGYKIVYDTNGLKGPNMLSNCRGEAKKITTTGATGATDAYADDHTETECQDTEKRKIYDQFGLVLQGSKVYPNGVAARYAFDN